MRIVDDEEMIAELHRRMLEGVVCTVESTLSAKEIIEKISANIGHYDVLITDQSMPEMKGTSLAKEVLEIDPAMVVLICTGQPIKPEQLDLLPSEKFNVLLKPVTKEELLDSVKGFFLT